MTIAYITHPSCARHDMGEGHPETPARLSVIEDQLLASGLEFAIRRYDAHPATPEQLERVHHPQFVERIQALSPTEGLHWLDRDTAMNPHTLEAAFCAAGAPVMAVDLVMQQKAISAFCAVRPPGHHAERGKAMGFCFFNNVAVGAAHALARYGVQRIAIIDFDVHHGNGTEDIFRDDPRVLFCSSFQHPYYPYTDPATAGANMLFMPLAAGAGSHTFRNRIAAEWLEPLDAFRPELIMISAGFDAHWQDEVADLNLNERDYGWVTRELRKLAERHAGGRIISVLEGGYALPALAHSVAEHLRALLD
jgi:acetoin utilization deacetylase AcuC-like enzyme